MDLIEKVKILNNHLNARNFSKVIEGCLKISKKIPNNSYILNLAGMAYKGLAQHKNAIHFFEEAIKNEPNNIAALNNLGNSFKAIGDFENSKFNYEKILKKDPNYINTYNNYANLKTLLNDYEGAIELFKKALALIKKSPKNSIALNGKLLNILFSLASAHQSINQVEEAKKAIIEALNIDPNHTGAHKLLSSIIKYTKEDSSSTEHLKKMQEIADDKNLDRDKKIDISFALGKSYDDLKDYQKAYFYLEQGNKLRLEKFGSNFLNEEKLIKNIMNSFKDLNLEVSNNKIPEKKIIFICGMPRSGTTLTEQIISSHSEVYGAGELIYLQEVIKNNFLFENKLNNQKIIDYQNLKQNNISEEYLKNFSLYNFSENIITDKAPQNFRWIGFIKIFFPNSKIIHCYRDPRDNCLSLFKNSFASSMMNWSNDQKDIANYYNLYSELMKFWKKKIPNFIYDLEYESLVKDKDTEIKKILEFCELDIDQKCFDHQKNSKTPIKTVSISQARQSIYNSSVNLNSKYDKYLKKMFNLLDKN